MIPIGQTKIVQNSAIYGQPMEKNQTATDALLRETSKKLEASFLSEMLKHTGLSKGRTDFGGGSGESQFSSFLTEAYAQELAEAGGIGLAENIFNSLKERSNGAV